MVYWWFVGGWGYGIANIAVQPMVMIDAKKFNEADDPWNTGNPEHSSPLVDCLIFQQKKP